MPGLDEFLARLDPKIARQVKTAQETELVKYPLASVGLTRATGGGFAAGRMLLLYGNSGSGKSLLALQTIGLLQDLGLSCAYFDVEGTYEKSYAARIGVKNDQLILEHKKSFGAITDTAVPYLEAGIDILVVDSVSDALPEVFVEKDGGVAEFNGLKQIGAHAKSCTAMINAFHYANKNTAIILVSQTTTKIESTYTKQVPHGGQKIFFSASQVIKLTSSNTEAKQIKTEITVGDRVEALPAGRSVEAFVEKNKLGPQHRTAEYDVYYDGQNLGVDRIGELAKIGVALGIINKGGAWFKWQGEQWQGEANLTKWLKENPEQQEKLRLEIESKS